MRMSGRLCGRRPKTSRRRSSRNLSRKLHRCQESGRHAAEPRAVHLDEVFQAFDADNDGHVHAGPETSQPRCAILANRWLAQQRSWSEKVDFMCAIPSTKKCRSYMPEVPCL